MSSDDDAPILPAGAGRAKRERGTVKTYKLDSDSDGEDEKLSKQVKTSKGKEPDNKAEQTSQGKATDGDGDVTDLTESPKKKAKTMAKDEPKKDIVAQELGSRLAHARVHACHCVLS